MPMQPLFMGNFLGPVGGILDGFFNVPKPLFRFAFGLFQQTLRLLFLVPTNFPACSCVFPAMSLKVPLTWSLFITVSP